MVFALPRLIRTPPFFCVPSAICASGEQWKPALTAMPFRSTAQRPPRRKFLFIKQQNRHEIVCIVRGA
jgi:hypothetical protein